MLNRHLVVRIEIDQPKLAVDVLSEPDARVIRPIQVKEGMHLLGGIVWNGPESAPSSCAWRSSRA